MIFQGFHKLYEIVKRFELKNNLKHQFFLKNLTLSLMYYCAGKDLKKKSAKSRSLKELVDLALNYNYSICKYLPPMLILTAQQIKSELNKFSKLLISKKPKTVLEIGTANGGTLFLLSRLSKPNSVIISVDLPESPYMGGIDYKSKIFFKSFAYNHQKIVMIREDSHKLSTLEKVKKLLKSNKVDVLFIDGDHTYNGVKKDFNMYRNLVRKNGIIVFHDIIEITNEDGVEVNKFWSEIKKDNTYIEIVEDWNQDYGGIGIIING
ncbi:MAG: class I SAM-dependent methyltransferase [Candidatus Lokiarchaeota archaeon]|nr:class I SAM-dependent methyltransferase [Candidatus Lokiarchaeota archaeon]